jgi:S-adenosylmethionine decarboxylase
MQTTGISLLLELCDCAWLASCDDRTLAQLFEEALKIAGFEAVDHLAYRFPGQGVTLIYILRQSHAALHTWPESNYVSVDVYSCGVPAAVRPALENLCASLAQKLAAGSVSTRFVERGDLR